MSDPEVRSIMSKLKGNKNRCFRRKHCLFREVILKRMSELIFRYQAIYTDAFFVYDLLTKYLPQDKLVEQRNSMGLWITTYEEKFKSPSSWQNYIETNQMNELESHQYVVKNEYDTEAVQSVEEVEYWWTERIKQDSQRLAFEVRNFTAIFKDRGTIPFLEELDRILSKILKGLGGSTLSSPDNSIA